VCYTKKGALEKVCSNYYPFGMTMPGRTFNSSEYRYGFNGMEKDDEVKGEGNSINYKARIYDPRIGKFLSIDPLTRSYPMLTPYQFASNTPIQAIDIDGLEAYKKTTTDPNTGKTLIEITIDIKVKKSSTTITDAEAISYAGNIISQLGTTFSGQVDENTEVIVKASILNLNVDDNNQVILDDFETDGAFYLDFVDIVEYEGDASNVAGKADDIGNPTVNRFQVRVTSITDPSLNRGSGSITRTGTHEIGHGLGLYHPWDIVNGVLDVDQQGKAGNYEPSTGVSKSTIKQNIMNSDGNKNNNLKPPSNRARKSTPGQREKISEVVPIIY